MNARLAARTACITALTFIFLLLPSAQASAASATQIDDPVTDTIQIWTAFTALFQTVTHELAAALEFHQPPAFAGNKAQAASAALVTEQQLTSAGVPNNVPSTALASEQSSIATTTVEYRYIPQPAITSLVQVSSSSNGYVTQSEFAAGLSALNGSLNQFIGRNLFEASASPPLGGGAPNTIAAASAIDQLSGVTITNANLTASEIPDLSGSYLPVSGGTIAGNLTVNGAFSGGSLSLSTASTSNFMATNATSTNLFSTFGNFTAGLISTLSGTTLTYTAASTTNFSNTGTAYFGSAGSTTIDSAGDLSVGGSLSVRSAATSTITGPFIAPIIDSGGQVFNVTAFGAIGNGTTDDTSAIQNAITAACNANGGEVLFGARYYKISSTLTINCNNVSLVGQGAGGPISPANPSAYTGSSHLGATVLIWAGSASSTMVEFQPSNGALYNIKGGGVNNMVLACYGIAGTGLELLSTNGLDFPNLTVENCTQNYVYLSITQNTLTGGTPYDTQDNDFGSLYLISDWNMPAVRSANGVYLDGNQTANSSFNVFDNIYGVVENGDLLDFANSDTNTVYTLRGFQPSGYTGNTIEFQASSTGSGAARDNAVYYVQEINHGNIQADGTGGSGSSHNNDIFEIDNGNGGGSVPIVQSGASLQWANAAGQHGVIDTNGTIGGYEWNASPFLYASSTNFSTVAGLNAGALGLSNGLNATSTTLGETVFGYGALNAAPFEGAQYNTAIGYNALNLSSGGNNTAVGAQALASLTTNGGNTAVGQRSLFSTTGQNNTAIGEASGGNNAAGSFNMFIGYNAGLNNNAGSDSVFVGAFNGWGNNEPEYAETGDTYVGYGIQNNGGASVTAANTNNTALGWESFFNGTSGYDNLCLGSLSCDNVTSGTNNIAIGWNTNVPNATANNQLNIGNFIFGTGLTATSSGTSIPTNLTGDIGIGTSTPSQILTLDSNSTTGTALRVSNSSTGGHIYDFLSTGSGNTGGAGRLDLFDYTSGLARLSIASSGNVGIASTSPDQALAVNGSIDISGGNSLDVGDQSFLYASSTNFVTIMGLGAGGGLTATSTILGDTVIGYQAMNSSPLNGSTGGNTAVGYQAYKVGSGSQNTAIGYQSLLALSSNGQDTAVGYQALKAVTGQSDTAAGQDAGANTTGGSNNVFFGNNSGLDNTNGSQSVFVGVNAGWGAGQTSYSATGDTYVGYGIQNNGGASVTAANTNNTALGWESFFNGTLGYDNLCLGSLSCDNLTSGTNNIAIGWNTNLPNASGSNQLNIGNFIFGTGLTATSSGTTFPAIFTGNLGIGTSSPYSRLEVWGPDAASTTAFVVANSASTTEFSVYDTGNAVLAGNLTQNSDQRLKTNIQSLNASSSLSLINELNPVTFNWIDPNKGSTLQLGFIAQQVQSIFPNLISTTSATALTPDGTLSLNYIDLVSPIVSAIQALSAEITSIENTIAGFAQSFTTGNLTFTRDLCANESNGTQICITGDQLAAMVAQAGQESFSGSDQSSSSSGQATDTPPVIQINGSNPAVIQVGATYNDLGATITGPQADLNLGITTFLNGTLTSNVIIDTSAAATDTIDYVATDQNGLTSTSTRTVVVEATAASNPPTESASSTIATSSPSSQ